MAASNGATTLSLLPSSSSPKYPPYITKTPFICLVASSTPPLSSPYKLKRRRTRKNHLRPKLLKTLPIPDPEQPDPILLEFDPIHVELEPPVEQLVLEEFKELEAQEVDDINGGYEAQEVVRRDINWGYLGNLSKVSIFRIGLGLVGAFVGVWVYRSVNLGQKGDRVLGGNEGEDNREEVVYVDTTGLEDKIAEIQEMAREARKKEKIEAQARNDKGVGDEGGVDVVRFGIEREVDRRLVKVEKNLRNGLGKDRGGSEKGFDVKEDNGALMFKKKYKFKSPLIGLSDAPKGFQSLEDRSVSEGSVAAEDEILEETSNGNYGALELEDEAVSSDEDGERKAPVGKVTSTEASKKKSANRKERVKLGKVDSLNGNI